MTWEWVRILCLFVMLSWFSYANGCRCFPVHPQVKVCSADFVFVGKVLREEFVPGVPPDPNNNTAIWIYDLQLIRNIKGISLLVSSKIQIETTGNSALCGIRLDVGQKYILSGSKLDNGKNRVISCDLVIHEGDLSFEQMIYFFSLGSDSYVKNCACKEITEFDIGFSTYMGCKLPSEHDKKFCYFSTAVCGRQYGTCAWRNADCD